jgi:hypothetical protein
VAVKHPEIEVELVGHDGNAFVIIGRVTQALRRAKVPAEEINQFQDECMSGDYDNLLRTCCSWVSVS